MKPTPLLLTLSGGGEGENGHQAAMSANREEPLFTLQDLADFPVASTIAKRLGLR